MATTSKTYKCNTNTFTPRLKVPVTANIQMGGIFRGFGQVLAQSKVRNDAVVSGAATLG